MIYVQQLYAAVMTETLASQVTLASLSFDTNDPYAVTLGIKDQGMQFARELLAVGNGGEGDVEVYSNDDFCVVLVAKEIGIVFEQDRVRDFLEATIKMVPLGRESELVDWDSEMKNILPNTDSDDVDTEGD